MGRPHRPSRYAPQTSERAKSWKDYAVCADPDAPVHYLFFAEEGKALSPKDIALAKSFCVGCPVRDDCLEHALTFPERHGVWGGLDEDERANLLRKLAAEEARELAAEAVRELAAEAVREMRAGDHAAA